MHILTTCHAAYPILHALPVLSMKRKTLCRPCRHARSRCDLCELQVGWNWGGSHAEGHVEDVIPHDATIESKGKEIKRKGTEDNPAVVVSNDKPGGNPVIKKASELHTFKEVRALYDTVLCLRAELPQAVHVRQHLIKHCQFWRCVQICEVPVARP